MKANYYKILNECIDTGISIGYTRAHKHTDDPGEFIIQEKIHDAIMELINENFIFNTFE